MSIREGKINVFIGFDQAESVSYYVLEHSIQSRAARPVSITPIRLNQLNHLIDRPWDEKQSNEFAFTRWMVPYLMGYNGWAIWMDCDMLVTCDINELWQEVSNLANFKYAVQVVKHKHTPKETTKYLGRPQTKYEYKNWSSVMVFNCSHIRCRTLTPSYINTAPGLDLHQFKWITANCGYTSAEQEVEEAERNSMIGEISADWNHLVGYNPPNPDAKNIHWTIGGPWFDDYKGCEHEQTWWDEYHRMTHSAQLADMEKEAS